MNLVYYSYKGGLLESLDMDNMQNLQEHTLNLNTYVNRGYMRYSESISKRDE